MASSPERPGGASAADPPDSPFRRRWDARTRRRTRWLAWLIGLVVGLLHRTLRVRVVDPADVRGRWHSGERFVFACWHEGIVLLPLVKTRILTTARPRVMLSWHRDGELAAQAVRRFGVASARGSANRGRLGAVREMLAAHRRGEDLVLVPDGPRGPRRRAKPGVLQVARGTGLPIVAIGLHARPARRFRSWDRMLLPLPFARVTVALGVPLAAGARDRGQELALLQDAMDEAAAGAERAA